MQDYRNYDNEEHISSNEPSSSHPSEPKALKRSADSLMTKLAYNQHKKYKINQRNNAYITRMSWDSRRANISSRIPSRTNRNIVQTEKDSKSNDLLGLALQSIMSKMGRIVKQHVSKDDKRKLAKKKLYDLINRRILNMLKVETVNCHRQIVGQYFSEYPFSKDKDVMRIFKEEELCPDVFKEDALCPDVFKEDELCPDVFKEDELCPEVFKEDELCPDVFKEDELCPDVPLNFNKENIVNVSMLPQADKISQIFETRLDEGLSVNMLEMIKNVGNYYKHERHILQCIDTLPDMNYLSDKEESSKEEENINRSENEVKMTNAKFIGNEGSSKKISEAEKNILSEYYKIIDDILTPRILQYLNKYKHEFEQILNNDNDYVEAKLKIMIELRNKIEDSLDDTDDTDDTDDDVEIISVEGDVISINSDSNDEESNNAKDKENCPEPNTQSQKEATQTDTEFRDSEEDKTNNVVSDASTTPEDNQLLIKLISNPKLTAEQMRTFLKKFNPAFVKQHKTVDNLLLIGFNNKQDYNNILGTNKSKVGNSTIMIIHNAEQKTTNNKTDKNNDISNEIGEYEVFKLNIESNATDNKEVIVINSPKRTENKMELDEIVVIDDDDDDDDDDVLLIQDNTIITFEGDTEKKVKEVDKKFTDATVSSVINTTPSQTKLKFLTMLIGRPTLPENVFIKEFLSRFNPISIKRHKVVNNVLLVGFNNRKDYDNILAANLSKVGSSILIIKHKDVNSPDKQYNKSLPKDDSGKIIAEKIKSRDGININSEYKVKGTKKIYVMDVDSSVTENNLIECTDSKREQVLCSQQEDLKKSESDEQKSYLEANVDEMMNKKISETISKVGQINEQSGCKLEKREKLEDRNGAEPEANENEAIKKMVDETFFKKLNLLEEHMVSLLRQDKEYNAVKTIILKNVERMKKGKELRDESDSDYENTNNKNRLMNSKDKDKIPKDEDDVDKTNDNILQKTIALPSNADSLNFKDRINNTEGNISVAKDVIVEHDDSQKEQDNSKITSVVNTNLHDTNLYSSEQNNPNALNSIPIVDKNENIPNNVKETERLESIELKSKDEKIDKEKQTKENEVRLLSLPKLPSNESLREFLSKYHITYKKKHKRFGNLLVIGLADETSYHSILAMDGTSIGDVKLVIRRSVT